TSRTPKTKRPAPRLVPGGESQVPRRAGDVDQGAGSPGLRLANLARRDATRAHAHVLASPVLRHDVDSPQIRQPAPARLVVRVAYVVPEPGPLFTHVANACHDTPSPASQLPRRLSRPRRAAASLPSAPCRP